jgi:hypothetical protein
MRAVNYELLGEFRVSEEGSFTDFKVGKEGV